MSEDFSKGKRGPVVKADPNKVRITIRLDGDILGRVRQDRQLGPDYQRCRCQQRAFFQLLW